LTLPLQAVDDQASDQNFRQVGERFPLQAEDIGKSAKQLFLQLGSAGNHKVAFGSGEVTFSASTGSVPLEVKHGLGVAPAIAIAGSGVNGPLYFSTQEFNGTRFKVVGHNEEAITGTRLFYWIAIG
jgi:hypothetical protein